jgi:membrane fusion protein, multidrug efflux system
MWNLQKTLHFLGLRDRLAVFVTKRHAVFGTGAIAAAALAALTFNHLEADAQVVPAGPQPVRVERMRPQSVHPRADFSGRISAVDYAEIRPQVSGRITDIRFRDGNHVKAGDILFVIDPRPYQAAVAKAEGDLASAVNSAKLADTELERAKRLMQAHALAQETYDQRVSASAVAKAAIKSAGAILEQARLDVDYAYVKAPISGRISRAEITLGNLVGTTPSPPLLAAIVSDDGVYVDFEVDDQTYLSSVRHQTDGVQSIPVDLTVGSDKADIYHGAIYSFDNRIDAGSGTIRARARFDNRDGTLVPGMFVSVRMGLGAIDNALLVPEQAIGSDQNRHFVYIVGRDNKTEYRTVTLGAEIDGHRVVESGLKPGDRVILDGLQMLAPGVPVAAESDRVATR